METVWQDIRFGVRVLRKNAGFTAVAVLTLALGIGANTALFSVIDGVLLRPLPYRDSGQLVSIGSEDIATRNRFPAVSYTKLQRIQQQSQTLAGTGGYFSMPVSLTTNGVPEQVIAGRATRNFFEVLKVTPARGRGFLPQEDADGGADVAILTDSFWHSRFSGNLNILGQAIPLDGRSVAVIGILPADFRFPFEEPAPDVWMPRAFEYPAMGQVRIRTGATYLFVIGRLRDGMSLTQARSEIATINQGYKQDFPGFADAVRIGLVTDELKEALVGGVRTPLLVLLAAVGFVLLIGCANVAGLLLARATSRRREIAIRSAIGASRIRLIRQLLTESALLSLAGGAVGVCLGFAGVRMMRALPPGTIPLTGEITLNASVLAFTLFLSLITGVGFGLLPSLLASRQDLNETLKEARGSSTQGPRSGRSQSALVIAEVAVAAVLVIGAGILLRSFGRLERVNPGLEAEGVMTFSTKLSEKRYPQPAQQAEFYRRLTEEVEAIPGVQSAAAVRYLPLGGGGLFVYFCPEGMVCQGMGKDPLIFTQAATPDYFKTMHIPLLRGRFFDEHDNARGKPAVIINDKTAKRYFAGRNAIGMHLANSRDRIQMEIVGVVGDVKSRGLNAASVEEMYQPSQQSPSAAMTLVIRAGGDPEALVTAVRRRVAQLDPDLPLANIGSMEKVIATSVTQSRLTSQFTAVFAILALLLTAIGIYGVVTYSVAQRTHEMGLRMALGARRADVLRLVIGQGMRVVLAGIGIGFIAALALTRLLKTLLFGTSATDPLTFGGVVVILLFVAVVACYLPARRAASVDPLVALRYE